MRKLIGFMFLLIVCGCDNSLKLNADFIDIPIVYGLLSISSENQFIRVERAFLDVERSATEIAVIPDSIYYPTLSVQLVNTETEEVFDLRKVNGNEVGFPRDEGAFAVDPNTLYTIGTDEMGLAAGKTYELRIDRGEGRDLVTAKTIAVDTLIITQPTGRLNFDFSTNFRVRWFPKSQNEETEPSVFDVSMIVNFDEVSTTDPEADPIPQSIKWSLGKSITDTREVMKLGDEFYVFLNNNLEVKPNIRRDFKGIDVVVDAGGEEILDYVRVGQANLGITASQEVPFFSNLSEGRGIFSSRNQKVRERILLSVLAQEKVQTNDLTKDLNFNF